jgi:hypothetical protein
MPLADFRLHILLCARDQWVERRSSGKLSTPSRSLRSLAIRE